jgi:hypothetical protein
MKETLLTIVAVWMMLGLYFYHDSQVRRARRDLAAERQKTSELRRKLVVAEAQPAPLPFRRRVGKVPPFSPPPIQDADYIPTWEVMPKELQWWERKEVMPLAKVLVRRDYLERLHALLVREAVRMDGCPTSSVAPCFDRIAKMRTSIDAFLKKTMKENGKKLEMSWWSDDEHLHYVASLTVYGGNLKKLRDFIGKQVHLLRWSSRGKVAKTLSDYFKKMVVDHGGPLIDRKFNREVY